MSSRFSYDVTQSEYDDFVKNTLVAEYRLPSSSLGQFASQGGQFGGFPMTADEREQLYITYIPDEMSHVVNQNEPEKTRSGAVVHSREQEAVWFLPSDVVENHHLLPELRQAFHEGRGYDEREADYKYHFPNGETTIAVPSSNPIERPDREYVITAIEYLGGHFPRKFLMETESGEYLYLRERAGSIRLIDEIGDGEEIFNAYVGREHPGMNFSDDELFAVLTAFDYITIVDDYETKVSEEAKNEYWGDYEAARYIPDEEDEDIADLITEGVDLDDMDEEDAEEWADAQPDQPHPSEVDDTETEED